MTRREWLKANPPPREASCPTHKQPLRRHMNRPEDLFVCSVGPHFLLWTKQGGAGAWLHWLISNPFPDLDKPIE
jgi:hypothetical protein